MSIISWCVFLKSRTSFSLFYPKHSLTNSYYSNNERISKVAQMAFLTSKATVRENGKIVPHFSIEKFKVSSFQKLTKMAFLIKNNWPRVITLLRLRMPFRTRFQITHFCEILGIFLFLSCHGLRCQDTSG